MNTIAATYPDGAQLEFDIPERWSELTRKQFAAVAPLFYQGNVINLIIRFAHVILGKKLFKKIQGEENMDEIIHAFRFLAASPLLEKSFYKGFKAFGKRWFGIDDKLLDMNIEDFGLCEQSLAYIENKLNQKIFFETVHNRGWLKVFPLTEKKKAAIRLNYEAQRANLMIMYPRLKSSAGNVTPDYHGLIIKISAQEFGDYNKTKKTLLHDVMKKLEIDAIEFEKSNLTK